MSILISASDRRIVVLRNGRIIGSAPIEIEGRIDSTAAYVLNSIDEQGHRWLRIPLPGQTGSATDPVGQRDRFRVAEEFRQAARSVLQRGTTVVITPDSLGPDSAREDETLLDAVADGPPDG